MRRHTQTQQDGTARIGNEAATCLARAGKVEPALRARDVVRAGVECHHRSHAHARLQREHSAVLLLLRALGHRPGARRRAVSNNATAGRACGRCGAD
eukprot:scaffold2321_cov329-Prasinococcus_capsulatus_cf.AAC.7